MTRLVFCVIAGCVVVRENRDRTATRLWRENRKKREPDDSRDDCFGHLNPRGVSQNDDEAMLQQNTGNSVANQRQFLPAICRA